MFLLLFDWGVRKVGAGDSSLTLVVWYGETYMPQVFASLGIVLRIFLVLVHVLSRIQKAAATR